MKLQHIGLIGIVVILIVIEINPGGLKLLLILPIFASGSTPIVSSTAPFLSDYPYIREPVKVGDDISISTVLKNPTGKDTSIIFVIEVRNSDGTTDQTDWQPALILSNETEYWTGVGWKPHSSGDYELRSFVISNFGNNTMTISDVKNSHAKIEPVERTCGGKAACITDTVTKIVDGDTLDIGETRIRLALVNTPEIGEQGYEEATEFTSNLCPIGSVALIDEDDGQTEGSFGRMIAKVYCGEKILNEQLLKEGLASIYGSFCNVSEFARESWAVLYC